VEAPLHDSFQATFVVHTHPAVVNGMCCAADGRAAWETLFGGDTLWIDYIDPGYTLCMEVRRRLRAYRDEYGADPRAVFLANHGVCVPGETPAEVGATYEMIVETLSDAYDAVGLSVEPAVGPQPPDALVGRVGEQLQKALGDQAACIASGPAMAVPDGPLTPDHIVYAKAYPLIGEPTERAIEQFRRQHGYAPRVILMDEATLCVGTSPHQADLAMELAVDGAQVARLCHAFGGVRFMTDRARDFIENWEVEAYRRKQAQ
jgi:rhamnose utilization protein RhaD (predicted bifunctional aldolase and dehydrogenase)